MHPLPCASQPQTAVSSTPVAQRSSVNISGQLGVPFTASTLLCGQNAHPSPRANGSSAR
ncbi:MAG: hypothetical protein QM765_13935 [Myxococcales bacterium]